MKIATMVSSIAEMKAKMPPAITLAGVFTLLPMLTGEGRSHHGEILREATKLVEAGKVVPRVDPRHFSLETAAQAHAAVESGTVSGKIVISVGE